MKIEQYISNLSYKSEDISLVENKRRERKAGEVMVLETLQVCRETGNCLELVGGSSYTRLLELLKLKLY